MDGRPVDPDRQPRHRQGRRRRGQPDPAGPAAGLRERGHPFARLRLPQGLEGRHRDHREARPASGRGRHPGPRSAAAPGSRRPRHRQGQPGPVAEHSGALEEPAGQGRGLPAGVRREGRRPRRQDLRGQGPGSQCFPSGRHRGLQAHRRPLRRGGHHPRHRHRPADQRRQPGRAAPVHRGPDRSAAGLCPGAAELRGPDPPGHDRQADGPGTPERNLHRQGHGRRPGDLRPEPGPFWCSCRSTTATAS